MGRLEQDSTLNLHSLCERAKLLRLEGFEDVVWEAPSWVISGGRLVKITGKNCKSTTLNFILAPKLGGAQLSGSWAEVAKSLFVLRFHRKNQSVTSHRFFITAIGYVAFASDQQFCSLFQMTPEILDQACRQIGSHYGESVTYNLHKCIHEFAAYCDANRLCRARLDYKYSNMKRPQNVGGLAYKRLDDPLALETKASKVIDPKVFQILGELYQRVPANHKYRFYILVLVLLACTGRRFSEIALLPFQKLKDDEDGRFCIEYFPRKQSLGDSFSPLRRLFLPTQVVDIVDDVIKELDLLCAPARETASIMQTVKGPNLSFLENISPDQKIYTSHLEDLGLPENALYSGKWLSQNGFVLKSDSDGNSLLNRLRCFTTLEGIKVYCEKDFSLQLIEPIHIDQFGQRYFLKDLLLVKFQSFQTSGEDKHWVSSQCTHSMMTNFLCFFEDLAKQFSETSIVTNFTTHHFRHTLNTLLDEGGLTDLLQAEWFGRKNPRDTKAYQHTSREKRALMLREDIKNGQVGGQIAEQIKFMPVQVQEAFLKARVNAVHDVGTGICVHNFAQTPCERHLQCSAECKDYVWVKDDPGRQNELKRQYAMTLIAREAAERQANSNKPKKSADWLAHNDKKLKVLSQQLLDNGVGKFDPYIFLKEQNNGETST